MLFVCKLNPVTEVSASSLIIAFIGMPSMAIALKILLSSILISKIRCEVLLLSLVTVLCHLKVHFFICFSLFSAG